MSQKKDQFVQALVRDQRLTNPHALFLEGDAETPATWTTNEVASPSSSPSSSLPSQALLTYLHTKKMPTLSLSAKKKPTKTEKTTLYLDEEVLRHMENVMKRYGLSKTTLINVSLSFFLQALDQEMHDDEENPK